MKFINNGTIFMELSNASNYILRKYFREFKAIKVDLTERDSPVIHLIISSQEFFACAKVKIYPYCCATTKDNLDTMSKDLSHGQNTLYHYDKNVKGCYVEVLMKTQLHDLSIFQD